MNWKSYNIEKVVQVDEFFTLYNPHYAADFNFLGEMLDFWECLYVIDGSVCVSADERIHHLSAGDVIFHKPMELHKFYVTDKNGADLLIFSFNMEGSLCAEMKNKVLRANENQRKIIEKMLVLTNKYRIETTNEPENLLENIKDKPEIQEFSIYVEEFIISLSKNESSLKTHTTAESDLFKKAVRYMAENIKTPLSVSDISDHLNISSSSLKRLFNKYAGMSVHKYFLSMKMKTATSLLANGMTVCEVSDELGFNSQGYFSVAYKRETGKSPSEI